MMLRALVRAKNGRTVLILGLDRDMVAQLQAGTRSSLTAPPLTCPCRST